LTLTRDCVEHMLSPRSPMALIIGASSSSQSGLCEHEWGHVSISRQNSGRPGGVLQHGDVVLTRDCVDHILSPRAPMALIFGASSSSQSGLSEHAWVHTPISRQNSGMPGGVLRYSDLALTRDCVEYILSPPVPMALIIGASCGLQSGVSKYAWVHMSISRHKPQMYSYTYIHEYVWF